MVPEMEALGRRAVACKGWRWMPGMLATADAPIPPRSRVVDVVGGTPNGVAIGDQWTPSRPLHQIASDRPQLPDFGDAPTRGALLELVREAWGQPQAFLSPFETSTEAGPAVWWRLAAPRIGPLLHRDPGTIRYLAGPTEVEALVAALEAAP